MHAGPGVVLEALQTRALLRLCYKRGATLWSWDADLDPLLIEWGGAT